MVTPYEEHIEDDTYYRTFKHDVPDEELKWHWDDEDRIIEPVKKTDWKFQFDNQLPHKIVGSIYIEKGVWHRIIKGSGDLELKIFKK